MPDPELKTPADLERMRAAGRVVAEALRTAGEMVAPGVTTKEIDTAVEAVLRNAGGRPAFLGYPSPAKGVPPYPASICASINEEVVHGIPGDRALQDGDIIAIDVGVEIDGFFGDAARTFPVGRVGRKASKLLEVTEECLRRATAAMRPGKPLWQVSQAIQQCAEGAGLHVVRDFVGHGIGRRMHEPPSVTNFVSRRSEAGRLTMRPGLVIAPEPMINLGTGDVRVKPDGWTVITKDHSLSAHFENTIAVTEDGPLVMTAL